MKSLLSFKKTVWWQKLEPSQKDLVSDSVFLLNWAKQETRVLNDYSFVIFPAVKAYEGFLKKLFFDLRLINETQFLSDYFRIGRALNPELEEKIPDDCLFKELSNKCGGKEVPKILWHTWKECRNQIFHYFHHRLNLLSLDEAESKFEILINAFERAISYCRYQES